VARGLALAWEAEVGFQPHALAVSADGSRAVAGLPGMIAAWDAHTGSALGTFAGAKAGLDHLALSRDGSAIASWGGWQNKQPTLWTAGKKGLRGKRLKLQFTAAVEGIAFHPDGARALAADIGGLLTLFEVASGAVIRTWDSGRYAPTIVRFLPETDGVLVAKNDALTEWDIESGRARRGVALGLGNGNNSIFAPHPDGRHIAMATAHCDRSPCVVVDTGTFTVVQRTEPRPQVRAIQYDPDGARLLILADRGSELETWKADGSERLSTFKAVTAEEWRDHDLGTYGSLHPLPDGAHVAAVVTTRAVHSVAVFAVASRARVFEWRPRVEAPGDFSPVTRLAVGEGGDVFACSTAGFSERSFFAFLTWRA